MREWKVCTSVADALYHCCRGGIQVDVIVVELHKRAPTKRRRRTFYRRRFGAQACRRTAHRRPCCTRRSSPLSPPSRLASRLARPFVIRSRATSERQRCSVFLPPFLPTSREPPAHACARARDSSGAQCIVSPAGAAHPTWPSSLRRP